MEEEMNIDYMEYNNIRESQRDLSPFPKSPREPNIPADISPYINGPHGKNLLPSKPDMGNNRFIILTGVDKQEELILARNLTMSKVFQVISEFFRICLGRNEDIQGLKTISKKNARSITLEQKEKFVEELNVKEENRIQKEAALYKSISGIKFYQETPLLYLMKMCRKILALFPEAHKFTYENSLNSRVHTNIIMNERTQGPFNIDETTGNITINPLQNPELLIPPPPKSNKMGRKKSVPRSKSNKSKQHRKLQVLEKYIGSVNVEERGIDVKMVLWFCIEQARDAIQNELFVYFSEIEMNNFACGRSGEANWKKRKNQLIKQTMQIYHEAVGVQGPSSSIHIHSPPNEKVAEGTHPKKGSKWKTEPLPIVNKNELWADVDVDVDRPRENSKTEVEEVIFTQNPELRIGTEYETGGGGAIQHALPTPSFGQGESKGMDMSNMSNTNNMNNMNNTNNMNNMSNTNNMNNMNNMSNTNIESPKVNKNGSTGQLESTSGYPSGSSGYPSGSSEAFLLLAQNNIETYKCIKQYYKHYCKKNNVYYLDNEETIFDRLDKPYKYTGDKCKKRAKEGASSNKGGGAPNKTTNKENMKSKGAPASANGITDAKKAYKLAKKDIVFEEEKHHKTPSTSTPGSKRDSKVVGELLLSQNNLKTSQKLYENLAMTGKVLKCEETLLMLKKGFKPPTNAGSKKEKEAIKKGKGVVMETKKELEEKKKKGVHPFSQVKEEKILKSEETEPLDKKAALLLEVENHFRVSKRSKELIPMKSNIHKVKQQIDLFIYEKQKLSEIHSRYLEYLSQDYTSEKLVLIQKKLCIYQACQRIQRAYRTYREHKHRNCIRIMENWWWSICGWKIRLLRKIRGNIRMFKLKKWLLFLFKKRRWNIPQTTNPSYTQNGGKVICIQRRIRKFLFKRSHGYIHECQRFRKRHRRRTLFEFKQSLIKALLEAQNSHFSTYLLLEREKQKLAEFTLYSNNKFEKEWRIYEKKLEKESHNINTGFMKNWIMQKNVFGGNYWMNIKTGKDQIEHPGKKYFKKNKETIYKEAVEGWRAIGEDIEKSVITCEELQVHKKEETSELVTQIYKTCLSDHSKN